MVCLRKGGRRTAREEKPSERGVRGGRKSFRSRLRGRMGPQCRQRSKRLREGFRGVRGAACLFTWITSSRKVDRAAAPRIGSGVGGVKKGGEPPAAPRRSSFEALSPPKRPNKRRKGGFKGTSVEVSFGLPLRPAYAPTAPPKRIPLHAPTHGPDGLRRGGARLMLLLSG